MNSEELLPGSTEAGLRQPFPVEVPVSYDFRLAGWEFALSVGCQALSWRARARQTFSGGVQAGTGVRPKHRTNLRCRPVSLAAEVCSRAVPALPSLLHSPGGNPLGAYFTARTLRAKGRLSVPGWRAYYNKMS